MKRGARGIIWAYDRESGNEQLMEIKRNYQLLNIQPIKERISKISYSFIAFENGDTWKSVYAAESARGHRANISYIDRRVPEDIVNCVKNLVLQISHIVLIIITVLFQTKRSN